MAWQYHGYTTKRDVASNFVFYPWYCHAIRGHILFPDLTIDRQRHLGQKNESMGSFTSLRQHSARGARMCTLRPPAHLDLITLLNQDGFGHSEKQAGSQEAGN